MWRRVCVGNRANRHAVAVMVIPVMPLRLGTTKAHKRIAARRLSHYRYSDLIPPQVVDSIRVGPQVHPSSQAPMRPQS